MADHDRQPQPGLNPDQMDFFELLRRLEGDGRLFGYGGRPDREPARLGQELRLGFAIRELIDAGLLHPDIACVHGGDLRQQALEPYLDDLTLRWREAPEQSKDEAVVRGVSAPFDNEGGLRRLEGNLGRCVVKISAVAPEFLTAKRCPARPARNTLPPVAP